MIKYILFKDKIYYRNLNGSIIQKYQDNTLEAVFYLYYLDNGTICRMGAERKDCKFLTNEDKQKIPEYFL
jgi:hypothetical protein